MSIVRSERGAAMVTALMLTMLALVISIMLLYSVMSGTRVAASQKRYRSALAAAHGGVEVLGDEILPKLFQSVLREDLESEYSLIGLKLPQYDCLRQKLDSPSDHWSACGSEQATDDPERSPDAILHFNTIEDRGGSLVLKERGGYKVLAKIVETVPGNTDTFGLELDSGTSVAGKDEVVHPQHIPTLYTLSVQGAREEAAIREKARLSVLYAY